MKYILEIIDEETNTGYDENSTIEAASPLPVPDVGEVIELGAGNVRVRARRYWFGITFAKVQLVCRGLEENESWYTPGALRD